MPVNLLYISLAITILWFCILTFFYLRLSSHYNRLTKGVSNRTMKTLLEDLLKESDSKKKDVANLAYRCDTIEKNALSHIQKIGLARFNPFKDTGGNQSFILCLLDAQDTGIVISGLYSRSGTRWYAKQVANGKGVEHDLSEEEKRAMKQAKGEVNG